MLRLIIAAVIFYLVFKFLKGLAYFTAAAQKHKTASQKQSNKTKPNLKTKIDQKDIVEAEFVEIKNREEK
ncbi:MAG: hypothetical protein AB1394_08990 [Bacteroidota bacterium]